MRCVLLCRMMNSNSKFFDDNNQGNMTQQSVLNAFDFSAIEEMDPSLGKLLSTHKIQNFSGGTHRDFRQRSTI
jgi:hypothetical protein